MNFKEHQLYGGAITAEIPEGAIDVSNLREVPDTQEVFLLEQPNKLDQAIIIDLLESVEKPSLAEIVSIHLSDILDDPPTFLAPLESFHNTNVEADVHTFLVKPAPSKQETKGVRLFMYIALLQVLKAESDVVITMTVPHECGEITQAAFFELAQKAVSGDEPVLGKAYNVIKSVVKTFKICDWDLFD